MLRTQYYNNIDTMPIYNYLQVLEQGNKNALIRKWGLFKRNFTIALEDIQRQLVNRFGISESYMEVLEKRCEIACLHIDLHVTDDRFNKTLIGTNSLCSVFIFCNRYSLLHLFLNLIVKLKAHPFPNSLSISIVLSNISIR